MVVHRTCSFCAGEIEPGTGQLFVKRDGSLFAFCSSSCRKQQMHLGRVGHRLRWTHAHELKRLAEQRRQPATPEPSEAASPPEGGKPTAVGPAGAKTRAAKKPAKGKPAGTRPPAKSGGKTTPPKPRTKKSSAASTSS